MKFLFIKNRNLNQNYFNSNNFMEEQQDSILNELLERIKNLEKNKLKLQEDILKKKEEIEKYNSEILKSKKEQNKINKIILTNKLPTEKEEEIAIKTALDNFKNLKLNKTLIENTVIEYIIEYTSEEKFKNLYIMGDFTKWEMIPMEKCQGKFTYKIVLLKGYKYYYSFQAGDEIIIDYNNLYEENPITYQTQNFIDLTENNKEIFFDYKKDMDKLLLYQKKYFSLNINIDEDEFKYIIKIKNREKILKDINKEKAEKYNSVYEPIMTYFDSLSKKINSNDTKNKFEKFRNYFKNKILVKNKDNNIGSNLNYYLICDISNDYIFLCQKLYDDNHIKINLEYYTHNVFYNSIQPKEISLLPITPESKQFHLLSLADSQLIFEQYTLDNTSIIKAYFKTLSNLKNENISKDNKIFNDYYLSKNIFPVKPKKIEPKEINIDDYDFYYSYNKITKVKNKKEQIDVKYIVIDESKEKNKIPNKFEIYYGIKNKKFFLIHCHVLDKDLRNIKMIIKEINKSEDPHIYKKNEEYIKNNNLLLLIQDLTPFKLYYQGKKVKMNSMQIEENKIYIINSPFIDSIYNKMYIKVINFDKKLNFELIEQCNEFSYSFDNIENIQNGVDIQIIFDCQKNYVSESMMLSATPCLLKNISNYEEISLKQNMPLNDSDEMKKYFLISQKIKEIRKINFENKFTKEEKDKLIDDLKEYSKSMEEILKYMEINEMWDNMEEAANISADILDFINMINKQ